MRITHEELYRLHLIDPEEILTSYKGCLIIVENPVDCHGMVSLRALRSDNMRLEPLSPEEEDGVLQELLRAASLPRDSRHDRGELL